MNNLSFPQKMAATVVKLCELNSCMVVAILNKMTGHKLCLTILQIKCKCHGSVTVFQQRILTFLTIMLQVANFANTK